MTFHVKLFAGLLAGSLVLTGLAGCQVPGTVDNTTQQGGQQQTED